MLTIEIEIGSVLADGALDDTPAGRALHAALPVEAPFEELDGCFEIELPVHDLGPLPSPAPAAAGQIAYDPARRVAVLVLAPTANTRARAVLGRITSPTEDILSQSGEILIRLERA
jgi:hypothetical protein